MRTSVGFGALGLGLAMAAACGGRVDETAGTPSGVPTGSPTRPAPTATAVPPSVPPAPPSTPPSPAAVCRNNADCNDSPTMSRLLGQCFQGVCVCTPPSHVQPSGKCGDTTPPGCAQQRGKCRQTPAECLPQELEGDSETSRGCGDFVAAVCCIPEVACISPIDLVCCGASTTPYEPLCENGWRTCGPAAPTPRLRSEGCP